MSHDVQRHRRREHFDLLEATSFTVTDAIALAAGSTLGGLALEEVSGPPVAGAAGTLTSAHALPFVWQVAFAAEVQSVVDSGGANGGWVAPVLLTLPSTHYLLLGSVLDITVASVAAGISATATVNFGVGTVATTTSALATGDIDHGALTAVSLTGGAGTARAVVATPAAFNNAADAIGDLYLNIGVDDADITATAAVTFSGTFRAFGLDLTQEG